MQQGVFIKRNGTLYPAAVVPGNKGVKGNRGEKGETGDDGIHKGSGPPADPVPHQLWLDTSGF